MVRRLPSKGCERASLEWGPCRPFAGRWWSARARRALPCARDGDWWRTWQSPGAVIGRGKNCGQKLGIEIRNRSPVREGKASEGKGIGLRQMIGRGRAERGDVLGEGYVTSERAGGSWTQFCSRFGQPNNASNCALCCAASPPGTDRGRVCPRAGTSHGRNGVSLGLSRLAWPPFPPAVWHNDVWTCR